MNESVQKLRESGLALYAAARKEGEYEVAYHALCAVIHAAERLQDAGACTLVERLANETRETIDGADPAHRVSSHSAAGRGHESIFKQLAVTAAAARLRMEAEAITRKQKGRPKAPS